MTSNISGCKPAIFAGCLSVIMTSNIQGGGERGMYLLSCETLHTRTLTDAHTHARACTHTLTAHFSRLQGRVTLKAKRLSSLLDGYRFNS